MGRKGVKKQFWLTREQAEFLEVSARKACIPEVQLIRLLLKGYQPPPDPGKELTAASKKADPEAAMLLRSEAYALKELRLRLEKKYLTGERKELSWL